MPETGTKTKYVFVRINLLNICVTFDNKYSLPNVQIPSVTISSTFYQLYKCTNNAGVIISLPNMYFAMTNLPNI